MKTIILFGLCIVLLASLVSADNTVFSDNCTSLAEWNDTWIGGFPYVVSDVTWFNVSDTSADCGATYNFSEDNTYGIFNLTSNFSITIKMRNDDSNAGTFRGDFGLNKLDKSYTDGLVIRADGIQFQIYWDGDKYWEKAPVGWNPGGTWNEYIFNIHYNYSGNSTFLVTMNGTTLHANTDDVINIPSSDTITLFGSGCNTAVFSNTCGIDWVSIVDYTSEPPPGTGDALTITITYPLEGTSMNIGAYDINATVNDSVGCSINDSTWASSWNNGSHHTFSNITGLSDGYYQAYVNCSSATANETNSSVRGFFVDESTPTITINPNSFFSTDNTTILTAADIINLTLNFTFKDNTGLHAYEINISNASNYNFWGRVNNATVSGVEYNFTDTANISLANTGFYNITTTIWDAHTATLISDIKVKKGINYILFDNKIRVTANGAINSDTTKIIDRYTLEFDYLPILTPTTKTYYIESDGPLAYLKDSKYKAHFVDFKNKRWIDFEGIDTTPQVTRINDHKYKVEFQNSDKKVIFNSLGGLNSKTEFYGFEIDNQAPTVAWHVPELTIANLPANETFYVVLNVTDDHRNSTTFYLFNTSQLITNYTINNTGDGTYQFDYTFQDMTQELYYINATHTDYYNNTATAQTITISSLFLDNCSTATRQTINFSTQNLTDDGYLASTVEFFFEYNGTDYESNIINKNYSTKMSDQNYSICLYPNSTTLSSDIWIDWLFNSVHYTYFANDIVLTNTSQQIVLYVQDGISVIQFRVTEFIGDSPVAGAYIKILKFDIGDGSYKTTEILKTDNEGYALGNIVLEDVWYKFLIEYEGITRLATEPEKFPAGTTTRNFRISLDETWYDNYDVAIGIEHNLSFNNNTNNFRFTFNDPTGAMHYGCLKVEKINVTGTTVIDDNCTLSTAATLLVNIAPLGTNLTGRHYIATGYLKFDTPYILDKLEKIWHGTWKLFTLGDKGRPMGLFAGFLITTTLVMTGIWHPITAVILALVGIGASAILGFYQITLMAIMAMVVVGFILIWKLNRR